MQVERRFRRRRLGLTPLIDVIFLLLLFFMLSSSFARHGEVELTLGGGGAGGGALPVFVRLTGDGVSVNGRAATDLAAAVERHRAAAPQPLALAVTGGATAQDLVAVLARLRAVPDSTLVVLR